MFADGGRSPGPRAQVLIASERAARAPRRALSPASDSSGEELTIDSRLLLHCSHILCAGLDNGNMTACFRRVRTKFRRDSSAVCTVITYRRPSH